MDPYIGRLLDNRYEILERIGTGGMAVVYKAKCHRLNRMVAVKILKSDLAQDEDFRRRFNAEAQAVAQLSHPNIVSVYDVPRGGDTEYIVMELIDGITLKQYMEKRGQLNWRESLHFITQIMRGLSHAHSRGIIHRDIKPQNVMVLRDGSVKVADFGIACLENSAQTLTQEALGSVHYISPEQARGDRTDARSDVYSAGVVLYEMLSGRLPFEGDSAVSVAIQHLSSIPLAPREVNEEIPEQLELICMKAMAPDLERRYVSADAMIADLELFRKNPDVCMDFELEDLRPNEADEPTRLLHASGAHAVAPAKAVRESVREHRRGYDYEEEPAPVSKKRGAVIVLVCIGAMLLAFFLFRSILGSFGPKEPEEFNVPSLIGLTFAQALEHEEIKDIFTITYTEEPNNDYPEGQIFEQTPTAGTPKKGNNLVIAVKISTGEEPSEMPYLVNIDGRIARQQMIDFAKKHELELEIPDDEDMKALMEFSSEYTNGFVMRTEPEAGELLRSGDTVKLIISKGPQTVTVPPFIGMQVENATPMFPSLKLTYTQRDEFSDKPAGEIIGQSPEAQTDIPEGSLVVLIVSKGPEGDTSGADTITIPLPTDKETVLLEIHQDGTQLFSEYVDCAPGSYFWVFKGTGESHITIYLDGEKIIDRVISLAPL